VFGLGVEDAVATLAERYGIGGLEFLPPARLTDWVRAEGLFGGVLHRESGSLNPLAYARGLARAAEAAGAQIFERSRVAVVEPGTVALTEGAAPHPRTRARLVTAEGSVSADRVILCLGGYHDGLAPDYAARVAPLRAFQIATEPLGDRLRDLMPGGVPVSDSRFVINCFRPTPDGRLLFGGGETSRPRGPGDIAERVRRRMTRLFPSLADIRIDHAWAGTLGISLNRAPVFRRIAPRLLAIGGWSGSGVHMASLGGEIAAEAILGEPERFELMARIPSPAYPARGRLRRPSMAAALAFGALKDRLG
ncbi:MAG: FAD-binding oxidoreductase, partial [Pseudomonadota bacterium]